MTDATVEGPASLRASKGLFSGFAPAVAGHTVPSRTSVGAWARSGPGRRPRARVHGSRAARQFNTVPLVTWMTTVRDCPRGE